MMRWVEGLVAQLDVIHALVLRETRTRFGANQMGYLWALIDPIFWILTFVVVFELANRHVPDGMNNVTFLATGIVTYNLFSGTVDKVSSAIDANRALLFYPQVRPIDTVFARSYLELVTMTTVFLTIVAGHALLKQAWEPVDNLLTVLCGLLLVAALGASIGLICCVVSRYTKAVDRIRGPLLRPLFYISGIFFTANELPSQARDIMLFNPVLHAVELVRAGWFPSYTATHAEPSYVLVWIVPLLLVGLTLERVARRRLELT